MKREQIIEILKLSFMGYSDGYFELITDQIFALPLDVPTDEEIAEKIQAFRKNKLSGYGNMSIGRLQLGELEWSNLVLDICKWMREEIIKHNS